MRTRLCVLLFLAGNQFTKSTLELKCMSIAGKDGDGVVLTESRLGGPGFIVSSEIVLIC